MRKAKKSILILSLTTLALACSKNEGDLQVEKPDTEIAQEETHIESKIDKTTEDVLLSIARLKSINEQRKSNSEDLGFEDFENVSVEEAVYYLEAAVNYDHFREIKAEHNFETHSVVVRVSLETDGTITGISLAGGYDLLSTRIDNQVPSKPSKAILVTNVWANFINDKFAIFKADVLFSDSEISVPALDNSDDWLPCLEEGRCNGSMVGQDASTRLEDLYNWYTPTGWNGSSTNSTGGIAIGCANNLSGTWTNVSSVYYYPNSYNNANLASPYFPWAGCDNECLYATEMEALLHDGFLCINDNISASEEFISVSYTSSLITPYDDPCYPAVSGGHFMDIHKGELHCGALPN